MTEMSLDTFINLYRHDHPDHTVRQAIEHLNELREEQKAMLPYFDHEDEPFPVWDSIVRQESVYRRGINQFREYIVIEGSTAPHGMGWPVQVRIPLKDWYKVKVVVY